jgi:hypothetical protein
MYSRAVVRCAVAAALAAAGRLDLSSVTRSHSCAIVAGGSVALSQCVLAANVGDAIGDNGAEADAVAVAARKAAVAFTSYRATLVPFNDAWWRAPDGAAHISAVFSPDDPLNMTSWLLPPPARATLRPHASNQSTSSPTSLPCLASASIACSGFSSVLNGTTAFSAHWHYLLTSSQPTSKDGSRGFAAASDAVALVDESPPQSCHDLSPCTITRINFILQRGQCNHSLLMLLAKSWAWASLRAALVPLSAPTSTHAVLQLISSAFPPPLSLKFSIPSTAPLSSRLRNVAQRLLELPSQSTFNAATALCLALTSDVVVGMSCMLLPLCHT